MLHGLCLHTFIFRLPLKKGVIMVSMIFYDIRNSIVYYGHALNIRESLLGDFHIETVCTLFNMGQVASYQNKYVCV